MDREVTANGWIIREPIDLKKQTPTIAQVENPTLSQIRTSIATIDGHLAYMLVLENRKSYIRVRGTQQGRYLVDLVPDEQTHQNKVYHLVDSTLLKSTELFYLKFENGEANDLPVYYAVTQDIAAQAVVEFILTGKLDESLTWQIGANKFIGPGISEEL